MRKLDELRKLIEENGSVSKFLGLMLDSESTYFIKFSGATQDPLKSLIVETIHDAGVRPDLTADEKELISGVILETLDETIMKMAKNQGTVRRSNRFFKELYAKMNESDQFSAIVASYMQDTMMDDLAKETSDGNLLAAIAMWIVCRSVLIPIVPIGETSQEVHVEQEKPVEGKKETSETVIDAEVVDGKVIEVPLLTEEETKKGETVEGVKFETKSEPAKESLEEILQKYASGLMHELESSGKKIDMGVVTSSMEAILKAATSTDEKKEGGTVTASASTAYKGEKSKPEEKMPTEEVASSGGQDTTRTTHQNSKLLDDYVEGMSKLSSLNIGDPDVSNCMVKILPAIGSLREKLGGDNLSIAEKENVVKMILATMNALKLIDVICFAMDSKIKSYHSDHLLRNWVSDDLARSYFKEFGYDDETNYVKSPVARDVIAYFILDANSETVGLPTHSMYENVDKLGVKNVVAFKTMLHHFTNVKLISSLACELTTELFDYMISVIKTYDNPRMLIREIGKNCNGSRAMFEAVYREIDDMNILKVA